MIQRRWVFAFFLLLCTNAVPFASYGAELGFHPYINLKEEYNDNLNLTSTNKADDYITTVQPGIRFSNMDKQAGMDLDYSLGAVFYKEKTDLNYISHNASLNAKYLTSAHINFYLKESFIRSDNPQEREIFTTIEENKYMLATETQRAPYWRNVVAPTIEYQFGPESRLGVNYRNNLYRSDSVTSQDSREDYINPFFSYWFDRQNGIALQNGLTSGDFETYPELTGHMANGRYIYRFSPKTSAFVEYTYSKRTFDSSAPSESRFKTDYDIHEPGIGMAFAIGPTLTTSVQVGYFRTEPKTGSKADGLSYKADLASSDPRTTYNLSLQGGYKEDYFTSENLGFTRYHRLTGSLNHKLDRGLSIGCMGSVERAEYDTDDRKDTIWGIGGTASYMPLKWLTFALEVTHKERQSNIDLNDYKENRAMLTITAAY
ncbi:MAG: outer membrane beta-barrel protein [Syntrophales bacterium]|nr:outer membrane beta-barrel protein [Syntrophales bacterium]